MENKTRTEVDSFGPLEVPSNRYWGAQTQRSLLNFPIGWERQPVALVRALGVIKKACAVINKNNGKLDPQCADAIIEAAEEVIDGKLDDNCDVGCDDGTVVGINVGVEEGAVDGIKVGTEDGCTEGTEDGVFVGSDVG